MVTFENRVLLAGFGAAVAGLVLLAIVTAFADVSATLAAQLASAWFLPAGIAAPQLYLAHRGEEPRQLRRTLAVVVIAFSASATLRPSVDDRIALVAGVAIFVAYLAYEAVAGYRDVDET